MPQKPQLRPTGRTRVRAVFVLAMTVLMTVPSASVGAFPLGSNTGTIVSAQAVSTIVPLLAYQGRLLTPASGEPKPDGTYTLKLGLYAQETGGTPLWSETKNVNVTKGSFSTYVGDANPLPVSEFDGKNLWLGVTVGSDPEAVPRQRITPTGYALFAGNSAQLGGQGASAFASSGHTHAAEAINAGSLSADRFSAYGDLAAENRIGTSSGQVAAGNHKHTSYAKTKCNFQFATFQGTTTTTIAHAFIADDGTKASGTANVTSSFNSTEGRYEIKISGYSYFWTGFTTLITPAGECNAIPTTNSVSGLLLVEFNALN